MFEDFTKEDLDYIKQLRLERGLEELRGVDINTILHDFEPIPKVDDESRQQLRDFIYNLEIELNQLDIDPWDLPIVHRLLKNHLNLLKRMETSRFAVEWLKEHRKEQENN